ncbi:unnamed protein product [Acanthoscelides obtectus]|uniref:Tc1-like transposase DDE domain-containing protein n=1 Tax=Acanthoscelides obtectus TaxID=200917 RepID=A0A9P0P082_ACAOB|nr:unnamed protein product [Acanthoscelides obtectus]CAK1668900.1 Transposable element Tc3 transposase [Acanthoscelides obtectus]
MELNREHFRAITYYNFQRQLSQQECLAELLSVFGNEAPHQSTISRGLSDDPRVDRHVTYREIEASSKLVSRWIPRLLTEEQKAARSAVWVFQREEKPTKVIHSRKQRTVTADWYTTICLPKVITELRKMNPERRIILHQDNASSHTAQRTRQYLTEENVELLDYPPYSLDLSPNDFFTLPKTKNRLRGPRFQSPEEAVDAFKNAVLDLPSNEWNKCFENWFERMQITAEIFNERHENSNWCRQRSLWDQEWNSIVFSDESRFCLGMLDGRARVRRRRGERRNPQFFVERHVHHTVGVMVWGAIAHGSRSLSIFIRGNMNAQRYIHEVLEPHLLPYLDTLADPTFQQDNARPHVARVTIDFFQHNDVTLLPWPRRSPDLSTIEHVWDMMGRRLLNLQRPPQTLEALREELVVAWNEIPQEDIDHLIRSMPRRVGECVAYQGASTHY